MTTSFNPLISRSIEEMRADLATQRAAAAAPGARHRRWARHRRQHRLLVADEV